MCPASTAAAPDLASLDDALPRPFGRAHSICMVELAERMLLRSSGAGPETLGQAAACLGVADRTLHEAFAAVRGTSPARHLKRRRLQLVRDALLAEPDRRSAVKWFAMAHGFRHPGDFAHAYHAHFSELPSETVVRAKRDLARFIAQEGTVDIGAGRTSFSEAAVGSDGGYVGTRRGAVHAVRKGLRLLSPSMMSMVQHDAIPRPR